MNNIKSIKLIIVEYKAFSKLVIPLIVAQRLDPAGVLTMPIKNGTFTVINGKTLL